MADCLVSVADDIRGAVHGALGTRPYAVATVLRVWSGSRRGEGIPQLTVTAIEPTPMVEALGANIHRPTGQDEEGEIMVSEISQTYTEAELYHRQGPLRDNEEFYWRIQEGHGLGASTRWYIPSSPPKARRGDMGSDEADWTIELRRVEDPEFTEGVFEFAAATSVTPSYFWPGIRFDPVSNERMDAIGNAIDGVDATGLLDQAITSNMFQFTNSDGTAWRADDAVIADMDGTSFALFVVWRSTEPNALRNILGKRNLDDFVGYELFVPANGIQIQARVQGSDMTMSDSVLQGLYTDGEWHTVGLLADRGADQWLLCSEFECGVVATLPPSASSNVNLAIGTQRIATAGQNIALVAVASGAQVEGMDVSAATQALHALVVGP